MERLNNGRARPAGSKPLPEVPHAWEEANVQTTLKAPDGSQLKARRMSMMPAPGGGMGSMWNRVQCAAPIPHARAPREQPGTARARGARVL